MRKHCRVLVTGAGSGVGQGIVKALRIAKTPLTIIGADIAPMNAALYRTDEAVIIPRVEMEGSLEKFVEVLRKNQVDVVMVGSEFDLFFFSQNKAELESLTGATIIASPLKTVQIADDKWLTAKFLRENNLPFAQSALPSGVDEATQIADEWGYPLVLKARRGTSSRHVHIVGDRKKLEASYPHIPAPML
jgi:carbamoyl-phosphate synthase large subunit